MRADVVGFIAAGVFFVQPASAEPADKPAPPPPPPRTDMATVLAIGATAFPAAVLWHEAVGHGLPAAAYGQSIGVSSSSVRIRNEESVSVGPHRFIAANGALSNGVAGGGFATHLLLDPPKDGTLYLFEWLSMMAHLHAGFGYLFSSPWFTGGDWGKNGVFYGMENPLPAQIGVSAVGLAGMTGTLFLGNYLAEPLLGAEPKIRSERQLQTTLWPWLFGSSILTLSAFFRRDNRDTEDRLSAVGTQALGTFLGTIFIPYIPLFFSSDFFYRGKDRSPSRALDIDRSNAWLVIGCIAATTTLAVLGPGVGDYERPHPLTR